MVQCSKENGKFDFVWVMGWDLKPCKMTYCMHNFGGGTVLSVRHGNDCS